MSKHAFFLNKGGSGGGGGTGGFALIKIEYPEGQEVTVTFDGETTTAPDTSGLWMYGCEETGTYTIAITGTTAEVEVEITTQGQIESVWISPQVINYALIYYLGNEFTNVDGTDEAKYAISTGGWTSAGSGGHVRIAGKTNVNINTQEFTKCFMCSSSGADNGIVATEMARAVGSGFISPGSYNALLLNQTCYKYYSGFFREKIWFQMENVNNFNSPIYVGMYSNASPPAFTSEASFLRLKTGSSGYNYCWTNIFAIGFVKIDDISGLSEYGNDIATILSNATDLFTDTTALNWMCLNCTGDFMISALSNANFVNAMNSSPNKSILVANEHWNRFIALLSV